MFKKYRPEESDGCGGFLDGKVRLYARAFERYADWRDTMHITLHEIGHYLDPKYLLFFREKRADQFAEKYGFGRPQIL